jgi:hypothetical protein
MRDDIEGVVVMLKDGSDIVFAGEDCSVSESLTEVGDKGVPAGRGTPVRYLTIICHMQPSPLPKGSY